MRFAWLKKNAALADGGQPPGGLRLVRVLYNAVWWLPIVFVLLKTIDYQTGLIAFAVVTAGRLAANLYLNNVLEPELAYRFPFRS